MSAATRLPSWLSAPAVDLAIEISSRRVTVAQVSGGRGAEAVSACGSAALPAGAVTPAFTGPNIVTKDAVIEATRSAFERAGIKPPRRVALVLPDSVARLTLVTLEQVPARTADLEQLLRFHVKKATPFPIEEAHVGYAFVHREPAATTLAAVVTRHDVLAQYEAIPAALGVHAGLVEISSLNLINAVLASPDPPAGDWLLVSLAPEATTLAIMRGTSLMFYRHRATLDDEPLNALVHQTAMYHEDRMGGTVFSRVVLCGAPAGDEAAERARRDISARLSLPVGGVDARVTETVRDRLASAPDLRDALAAPVGLLLRERQVA
jgi:Tfp pilus assembly PilM family ATPase